MKLVTAEEMRSLDTAASSEYGISLILMENAGRAVAEKLWNTLAVVWIPEDFNFSGKGNNGGDGFVAARHLANKGADVKVFLLYPREEILGMHWLIWKYWRNWELLSPSWPERYSKSKIALIYADLVIDAIFGTGFKGKPRGHLHQSLEP